MSPFDVLVRAIIDSKGQGVRPAARLMTLVENEPHRLPELFRALRIATTEVDGADPAVSLARLQPRLLVGITGAPGSGKSTLTDALVREFRLRHPDRRVGVVAVDPSSPFTGGAVLGDRVRMMRHATDPLVFVRSVASRGHLGGLALGVKGIVHVLGLTGCDVVFLETVGVGQSEVEVARVADLVLIVLAPGQGDGVQLLKAGLMEVGDLFIVNKADRPDAARLHGELLATLRLRYPDEAHHRGAAAGPPAGIRSGDDQAPDTESSVLLASATGGEGIVAIADAIEARASADREEWMERRRRAIKEEIHDAILEAARNRLAEALASNSSPQQEAARLLYGEATVESLADELVARVASRAHEH